MGGQDEGQFHRCLFFLRILCCQTHDPVCVSGIFSLSRAVRLFLICLSPFRIDKGQERLKTDMAKRCASFGREEERQ